MKNIGLKCAAAGIAGLLASTASASTVLVEYGFEGSNIENETVFEGNPGVDIVPGTGIDLTFIAATNVPIGPVPLDGLLFDDRDGAQDFGALVLGPDPFPLLCFEDSRCVEEMYAVRDIRGPVSVSGGFARVDGALKKYERGDTVYHDDEGGVSFDPLWADALLEAPGFGPISDAALLYSPFEPDALAEEETAIFGFMLKVDYGYGDYFPIAQIEIDEYCYEMMEVSGDDNFDDCRPEPQPMIQSYFGFVEVTRGSLTPGMVGYNTLGGGALIPSAVPLPAAGWMLIAGVGGLLAMGRRRSA